MSKDLGTVEWFAAWVGVTNDNRLRIVSKDDIAYEFQVPEHMVREWIDKLAHFARDNCAVVRNKQLPMMPNIAVSGGLPATGKTYTGRAGSAVESKGDDR